MRDLHGIPFEFYPLFVYLLLFKMLSLHMNCLDPIPGLDM